MRSTIKNMRLPNQVSIGSLIFIIIIFLVIIVAISELLSTQLDNIVSNHQQTEVSLVAHELETEHRLIKESLIRSNTMSNSALTAMLHNQNGQYILVDNPLSNNSPELLELERVTQSKIIVAKRTGNNFNVTASTTPQITGNFTLPSQFNGSTVQRFKQFWDSIN